jgi:hypothetical protein
MSLNNIELPDFIIGEWYKDTLLPLPGGPAAPATAVVTIPPAAAATPPPPPAGAPVLAAEPPAQPAHPPIYKFLGNNHRKVALLVHSPGSAFLPDNQLAFLTKILEACRMTIADVAIVNHAATPVTITALRQQLSPAIVLLFGMEPVAIRLPINFPVFKLQTYDQCTYLSAPALDQLVLPSAESQLLKSKLWVCLKTMFNV